MKVKKHPRRHGRSSSRRRREAKRAAFREAMARIRRFADNMPLPGDPGWAPFVDMYEAPRE